MNNHTYSPNILISPHTNRPITDMKELNMTSMWCKLCCVKLPSVITALQHMKGRPHLYKVAAGQKTAEGVSLKHKQQLQSNTEPAAKKSKNVQAAPLKSKQQSQANNMPKGHVPAPAAKKSKNVQAASLKPKQQSQANNMPKGHVPVHAANWSKNLQAAPLMPKQQSQANNMPKGRVMPAPAAKMSNNVQAAHINQQPRPSIIPNSHVSSEPGVKNKNALSELESNLICEQCNLTFDSLIQSLRHFKYTKHDIIAPPCEVGAPTNQNSHSNGDQPVHTETIDKPLESDKANAVVRCEDCDITFKDATSAESHFQGKRHKKTIAAKEVNQERDVLSWWQQSGGGRGAKVGSRGGHGTRWPRKQKRYPSKSALTGSNTVPVNLDRQIQSVLSQFPNNSSYGQQNFHNGMQNTSTYGEFRNLSGRNQNSDVITSQYDFPYNESSQYEDGNYSTADYQARKYMASLQPDEFGTSQHRNQSFSSMNENNIHFNADNDDGYNENSSLTYENY